MEPWREKFTHDELGCHKAVKMLWQRTCYLMKTTVFVNKTHFCQACPKQTLAESHQQRLGYSKEMETFNRHLPLLTREM